MSSEYTVREEVERRVVTDTHRIVHNASAEVHTSAVATSGDASSSAYTDSRRVRFTKNVHAYDYIIMILLSSCIVQFMLTFVFLHDLSTLQYQPYVASDSNHLKYFSNRWNGNRICK